MLMLLLSLLLLNLTATLFLGWILYQVSGQVAQMQHAILAIQRLMNAYDRPESLAVSGVAPGSSWIASEGEIAALQQKLLAESEQRAGLPPSKRISTKRTASLTASSP